MALKNLKAVTASTTAPDPGTFEAESEAIKGLLASELIKQSDKLVPIEKLRDLLDKELKGLDLNALLHEMRD